MLGYDAIIVLPILLLLSVFAALIAVAVTVLSEAASKGCPVCGVEFIGKSDMREHMKEHIKVLDFIRLAGKETPYKEKTRKAA
jgi:hypothetical protein